MMSTGRPAFVFNAIPDILAGRPEEQHGKTVRTIGRLKQYNVKESVMSIEDLRTFAELMVDCRIIEPFSFRQGALYQFCGELDGSKTKSTNVVLKAHLYRCVEGLDMDIYMKALAVRSGACS